MDLVIIGGGFLVVLLFFLILIFFIGKKKKNLKTPQEIQIKQKKELKTLVAILQNKETSTKNLEKTLDLIVQDYGRIYDFSIYENILLSITHHPRTNKNIIINFDKKLSELNPKYKLQISKAVTDGLNSRRV